MIPEAAWNLVPEVFPTDTDPWVLLAIHQTALSERQARAYAWAHTMLRSVRDSEPPRIVPGLQDYLSRRGNYRIADITAGFIPFGEIEDMTRSGTRQSIFQQGFHLGSRLPDIGFWAMDEGRRWSFGVVIGVESTIDNRYPEDRSPPPDLSNFGRTIRGAGPTFLVVVERREVAYDAPPNPVGSATSACYVRPRPGKHYYNGVLWTEGILTARHVLVPTATAPGTQVTMASTPPTQTTVADIDAATTIDAVILDSGVNSIPQNAMPLSLVSAVAPGLQVTVHGAQTQFTADILRVMDDPVYFGNMVAHRAFIDAYGSRGDSGALASGPNREAVGIYIGKDGGPREGLLQLMRQVTKYFEVDLYL
jgi:hypothetical protein